MAKIKKLSKEIYEKIKAGEVIEDPASVVRELLDNALDSGANRIEIDIQEGGLGLILVKDNGSGMEEDDLELCFLPHATSKINRFEDIFSLSTAGFRGEALSSIAKVSQLKILSSSNDSGAGNVVLLEGGKLVRKTLEKREKGTSIFVKELFYNVPVRRNFSSSPTKEIRKIKEEVLNKALAHPQLEIILNSGKNNLYHFTSTTFEERINQVFKNHNFEFLPFNYQTQFFSVRGMISSLNHTASSTNQLYFFINNRFVKPRFLYAALNSVFANLIPRGRYPAGVFYLYLESGQIDPNIHPSKKEIRILNENQVFYHFTQALKKVFYPQNSQDAPFTPSQETKENPFSPFSFHHTSFPKQEQNTKPQDSQQELFLNPEDQQNIPFFSYLGVVFETYLLVEINKELWIIDFHAAHERHRYEELKARFEKIQSEDLLSPRIFNLTLQEINALSEKREFINHLGFQFYLFGEDAAVITGVPVFYQSKNWEDDLKEILNRHQENENPLILWDKMLKSMACRGSYMAGEKIHPEEAKEIIKLVVEEKIPLTCPHGRPLVHKISSQQMANFFLRNG